MTHESSTLLPARRSRLRRSIFALAAILSLIVLFYAEENWRGKLAWENYKRERIAKGENFDNHFFELKKVPDDQNFYKTPLLEANGYRCWRLETNKPYHSSLLGDPKALGNQAQGYRTKLSVYYDSILYYESIRTNGNYSAPATPLEPAADIVRLFNEHPDFNELRKASLRPYSQCNPMKNPLADPIPNYVALRSFAQGLMMVSKAELELGDNEGAFRDAQVIMKFADAIQGSPILVSAMIRVGFLGFYTQTFWEGWVDQRWTDQQYAAFQTNFLALNTFADCQRALQGERASMRIFIEEMPIDTLLKLLWNTRTNPNDRLGLWLAKAAPSGWYSQNLLNYHRGMETLDVGVDSVRKSYDPSLADAAMKHFMKLIAQWGPSQVLMSRAIPNFTKAYIQSANNQAFANMAAIVCGLERFRHAEGHYPSNLDELSPKYITTIPMDVIGGEPFHYHVTAKGFQLYSVGLDGKDNGGTPAKADVGDWVWMYPVDS